MSKRRMIILVIVAMTFMYMIVGIVSFISIRSGVVKNNAVHRDSFYHDMNIYANVYISPNDLVDLLDSSSHKTPKAIAAYDRKGKLLAISSFSIEVSLKRNQTLSLPIDDAVVARHLKEFGALKVSHQYLNVNEVSFYTKGAKRIVTRFSVGIDNGKKNFPKTKTIILSKHPSDHTYVMDHPSLGQTQVYDMSYRNNINMMKKTSFKEYLSLKKMLSSKAMQKEAQKLYRHGLNGKRYLSASRSLCYVIDYEYQGKPYLCLAMLSQDATSKTLDSRLFRIVSMLEAFLFFSIGGLIIIIINYYYEKGEEVSEAELLFMNASAHELRTPITIISSTVELIEEGVNPQKNAQYFAAIKEGVDHMSQLVSRLLYYNGLYRREKVASKPFDLVPVIEAALKQKQATIARRHLHLTKLYDRQVMINGSQEIMTTLVANFIANMIDYCTKDGDICITITHRYHSRCIVSFFNSHAPIDEKTLKSYWTAFKRERSDASGSGLGLAINKRILDIYHYPYDVKNVPGGIVYSFETKPYSIPLRTVGYIGLFLVLAALISIMLLGIIKVMMQ